MCQPRWDFACQYHTPGPCERLGSVSTAATRAWVMRLVVGPRSGDRGYVLPIQVVLVALAYVLGRRGHIGPRTRRVRATVIQIIRGSSSANGCSARNAFALGRASSATSAKRKSSPVVILKLRGEPSTRLTGCPNCSTSCASSVG